MPERSASNPARWGAQPLTDLFWARHQTPSFNAGPIIGDGAYLTRGNGVVALGIEGGAAAGGCLVEARLSRLDNVLSVLVREVKRAAVVGCTRGTSKGRRSPNRGGIDRPSFRGDSVKKQTKVEVALLGLAE